MATKRQKDHAWENAKPVRGKNPDSWRRDAAMDHMEPKGNTVGRWTTKTLVAKVARNI